MYIGRNGTKRRNFSFFFFFFFFFFSLSLVSSLERLGRYFFAELKRGGGGVVGWFVRSFVRSYNAEYINI